ncbi:Mpv17/PMP22 [Penicillium antarcticum]|uniref:Mpv17/PMP22 n=1 Tax=Penicillium antarcticum TaxID=416450 RepID=UPI00238ECA75|nr:Mpv17/PMP22 [Penicillium antarcticum]KAJ5294967.1 Mpv17/PMP22 [Penicillium antarcticum]
MTPLPKSLGPRSTFLRPRPITPGFHPLRRPRCHRYKSDSASGNKTHKNASTNTVCNMGSNATQSHSTSHLNHHASPPPKDTPAASAGAATPPIKQSRTFGVRIRDSIKAGPAGKLGRWYARVQHERPYTTQFWSSIVIYLCGDLSAQMLFPAEILPEKGEKGDAQTGQTGQTRTQAAVGDGEDEGPKYAGYDPYRTMRHLVVGAGSSIPSYNWFLFLGNHFNYPSKILSILTKVVVQQTCFTPVFNTYFFSVHSLLGGATMEETYERLKKALPVSITNSVKLWPVVTAFSFMYIPAQFRNVFSGVIAVGWQTYLSWLNQKAAKEVLLAEIAEEERVRGLVGPGGIELIAGAVTDEEEILDDLLKAATENATVQPATPTPSSTAIPTSPKQTSTRSDIPDPDIATLSLRRQLQPSLPILRMALALRNRVHLHVHSYQRCWARKGPVHHGGQARVNQVAWAGSAGWRVAVRALATATGPARLRLPKRLVEHTNSTEGRTIERERSAAREQEWIKQDPAVKTLDTRSPVERFRRAPNKAFSVTDLVSPAWCELQYWYTLTKHGRKKRTPAMLRGSTVHKTLEDEIYTTVPVEISTKEDAWGLRVWNIIQGLRMLREYGVTREMEVWGLVDGEIVNGVIDQLSYECPDSGLEGTAAGFYADLAASRVALPEYQMSLSDFLLSSAQGGRSLSEWGQGGGEEVPGPEKMEQELPTEAYSLPRVYLTDIKTKASRSIPTVKSTGFRPTLLQLQLYYHMLNRLITSDDVTIDILAARYNFSPESPFTSAFVSEVDGLNDEFFDALSSQEHEASPTSNANNPASNPPANQDSTSILMTHNTLSRLWAFMIDQLRLTFLPETTLTTIAPSIPATTQPDLLEEYQTLLSPVLTARYLSSAVEEESASRHLGSRSFLYDPTTMTSYLSDQMTWWRGERDPCGVEIMDAWKCRICEFRDECEWRQERELAYARRGGRRRTSDSADMIDSE